MSTTNVVFDKSWKKIVNAGDEFLLTLPFATANSVEVATKDTDVAPAVQGHVLRGRKGDTLTRSQLGPGYVYARSVGGAATVVLNAWTPTT